MPRVRALNADEYGDLDRGADLVIGTRPPPETLAGMRVAALPGERLCTPRSSARRPGRGCCSTSCSP